MTTKPKKKKTTARKTRKVYYRDEWSEEDPLRQAGKAVGAGIGLAIGLGAIGAIGRAFK